MVEIKNYCKSIKSRPILNNVSYNFEYGKIYGIYGHNGSGKTMLFRAIAGLLVPDSGSVVIDGKVLHKDMSFPPSIGIVIENMNLLPQYNAFDNLKILGKITRSNRTFVIEQKVSCGMVGCCFEGNNRICTVFQRLFYDVVNMTAIEQIAWMLIICCKHTP